ncbi:hypothetical protein DO021_02175 [Desulfobacter hydrogenophilus]|uniref:Uncharacterized protein n=1 Tax=Desulfobacter hydrogenophilus TaxID=2291 RepID=A0A328FG28_9BACT|nr:hypothetical protein [Desulfobacter hydrogenophilus]RAM03581.1 hypothetical protein DO021_02175 [Desulfobacter hydrogenophilus]
MSTGSDYTTNVIADHGVLDSGFYSINVPFSKQNPAKKVRDVLNNKKKKNPIKKYGIKGGMDE